jgi:hypothetical protein
MIIRALLSIFILTVAVPLTAQTHLVLTAALTQSYSDFRKKQYISTCKQLVTLGYTKDNFYIVEALNKKGPTFLDAYCNNVFYATTNNASLRNKGINEALTLNEALYYFNFDDDDIIIKMTGRYFPLSDYFFNLIKNNLDYDAFFFLTPSGDFTTLAFAMRCKYLKEMYQALDYALIEGVNMCIETAVSNWIKHMIANKTIRFYAVDKLNIRVELDGSATNPTAQGSYIV